MTKRNLKKERREIPLRPRGELITPTERPSKLLFDQVLKAEQTSSPSSTSLTGLTNPPSSTSLTGLTNLTEQPLLNESLIPNSTQIPIRQAVSPEKDFTKTPNSVVRLILAQGLFAGKSKLIYDYAWSVSRGAIKPQRTFRKTQNEIKKGTGIGSLNTIKDGIKRLESLGLFKKIDSKIGERNGSEFEIFTPEELGYTTSTSLTGLTGSTSQSSSTELAQKLVRPVEPVFGLTGLTQTPVNIEQNDTLRHSLKTNKNDDEAFAVLNKYCREVTGRDLTENDYQTIKSEMLEILGNEMLRVRGRTKSISSFSGVLIAHLKSIFSDKPKIKTETFKKDTVGANKIEFNLERELATLRELIEIDGLETVLASIDTYDFTKEQKEALRQGLTKSVKN